MQLSQPSVSLQIKALEQELGTQLFERRGPRIELTHDGHRLLELARPLVEGIDGLRGKLCVASRVGRPWHGEHRRGRLDDPIPAAAVRREIHAAASATSMCGSTT